MIYNRGGTVHRCHGSVRNVTSVRGSRFDTISVQHEKKIYYARFLFIYFEQTVEQIKKMHLDVEILHIITCYIYIKSVLFSQIKADLYTVIINKTISV